MEETLSLQDLFKTIKKRATLIFLVTIFAITLAGVYSYLIMTPIYQSSTQLLVNQQKTEQAQFNTQDIQTNLQLINTYKVIIKSPAILSEVIEKLDLDQTADTLNSNISINNEQNSQVVVIKVEHPNPALAAEIANTTAEVFQEKVKIYMKVDNVNILSPAKKSESPIKPTPNLNIAIAAVVGLMIGIGIAFLLEFLDTTIKTEQDVEEILSLPIIGLVSPITDREMPSNTTIIQRRRRKR
ncbi:Wzz/FepE/Etk N-terminal domain-containing protein [Sporosarcina saromensis]|uniref:Wzz/FepE/Etk N-terminal domain-containing protein n=1 Tax=Sporosarcina saromensis TaxID=359365 RepID=A0ABU4G7Q0_9BACL|nr:Wzz/FepE/Etk N-terminal domain-containing protein [Sporosarcina saromensis]MDW0112996.1 Wzz/FepE/Etk N-terminal domain-containing protein [Sporosarcina saromensis]